MRPCPACKSSVADEHRFCGYCGARLEASSGPDVASSQPAPSKKAEPLGAKTRPEAPLSPLATSAVMDAPIMPRVRTAPTPATPATPSLMQMPRVKREATDPPGMRRGLAVMVTWADGNKYPGALERIESGQCLVTFQDGQQRWIERAHVEFVKG